MDPASKRHEIVEQLRRDIARRFPGVVRPAAPAALQGARHPDGSLPFVPARHPTGHPALDALLPGGGFPPGRIVTIAGSSSSGKLSVALAAVAQATTGGACCAFIDTSGEFFPPSAAACGIDLDRLLVVRAPPPTVPRATCVTVQSRAFALVVLDLSPSPGATRGAVPGVARGAVPGVARGAVPGVARGAVPDLTAAQARRLGALCRESDVTLLALGTPAVLRSLAPAATLRLRATRSPTGTRIALDGCASAPPATAELLLVRHASYCLRPTTRLRLAGPPAGQRR
jgi:hypothetical protein